MKDKIKQYITDHKNTSFLDIYNNYQEEITKQDLKIIINEFEADKIVISAFNQIYYAPELKDHEGFIQWSLNGFCWVDKENKMNDFGVTFDIPNEAVVVINKKQTPIGVYSKGKIVEQNDKKYFFAQEITDAKNYKIIYYTSSNGQIYQLNNSVKTKIDVTNSNSEKNSINEAFMDNEIIIHVANIGNLSDKGIESKIAFVLGELKIAPENDSHQDTVDVDYKDFTKKKFFTIDSFYTKDIDDAICFEKTKIGYNLFVAIADVSHYVLPDSKQDEHAKKSANSFYLAHQTVHMLDRSLAEKECSLNPCENKQTMVCKMSFDEEGSLQKFKFIPALILSHAKLTYSDVDLILDKKTPTQSVFFEDKKHFSSIKNSLISLNLFRQLKPLTGNKSTNFYSKPDYNLNENGKVESLSDAVVQTQSEQMVEFSMLHANICAANHLFKHYPEIGLFRNQSVPIDINKPKAAFYDSNNDGHWGLSADFYTHFTSPIRRYCDLIVHRLIKDTLRGKTRQYDIGQLSSIAKQINLQQTKSKHIELKVKNMLINQHIENLFNDKSLGKTMTIIDYNENGLVAQNKQKIEYFIPLFKLNEDIYSKLENSTPEEKQQTIKDINSEYKIIGFVDYFNWVDERKNVSYLIKDKTPKIIEEMQAKNLKL